MRYDVFSQRFHNYADLLNSEVTVTGDLANVQSSNFTDSSHLEEESKETIPIVLNPTNLESDVFGLPPAWAEVCTDNDLLSNKGC